MQQRRNEKTGEEETEDPRQNPPTSGIILYILGAAVAERLACSPPPNANRVQSSAASLPDFRKWESCRTMPLVGRFSRDLPFPRNFLPALLHTNLASSSSALKTSMLRARRNKRAGEREIPEKTRRPKASSGTITTCENPGVTRPGIERGSRWWEASRLTAHPQRPHQQKYKTLVMHDIIMKNLNTPYMGNREQTKLAYSVTEWCPVTTSGIIHCVFPSGNVVLISDSNAEYLKLKIPYTALGSRRCEETANNLYYAQITYRTQLCTCSRHVQFIQLPGHKYYEMGSRDHGHVGTTPRARTNFRFVTFVHILYISRACLGAVGYAVVTRRVLQYACVHAIRQCVRVRALFLNFVRAIIQLIRNTLLWWGGGGTLVSRQGEPGSIPGRVTGFSLVGIVPDDAVGRRIFSGIFRFPPPIIPAPLHIHFNQPHWLSRPCYGGWKSAYLKLYSAFEAEKCGRDKDHFATLIKCAIATKRNALNWRATVAERLLCSPPTKAIRVQSPAGSLRILACGNRAGRCHWSAGPLEDLPLPPAPHSDAALYSPQSHSSAIETSLLRAAKISSLTHPTCTQTGMRPATLVKAAGKEFGTLMLNQPMRAIEVSMEQRRNARTGKTGDPQENRRPAEPSNTITTHKNPGTTPLVIEPCSPRWDASSLTTTPPRPL
ncbi:hypothetical protein PR048_002999 [Dryococelus australis]|uniref:Uncharacterized protein n=1 Tax=Dryococelus australis TaxID=614101 RepID=A0ABQ9ILR4_9NEOP|nr:hypothetical protein PR048_002999 [Dryococelus australis]